MEIAVSTDKRVFIIEKVSGKIRIFDLTTSQLSDAGQVAVFSAPHEGLLGLTLDPNFVVNHFVYVYYSHATIAKHVLARFTESGGKLADATMKVMLEIPGVRWTNAHHAAGSLTFGPDGNLYLATGENVDPSVSQGYASVNEALRLEDTQATSANTKDLNGKILRIHPEPDGSYTLPAGNLFTESPTTKGEIFAMGMRNPFRIAIDTKTGWLYWGEPGPDATVDSPTRGPMGWDEINRAKAPGFFGWPYFIAENLAYVMNGVKKDPANPINNSINNSGLKNLPAAQPSLLAYTDVAHSKYSAFGVNGARAAIMGGVYNFDTNKQSSKRLPPRFDGSLFIMDWARHIINEVRFTPTGEVASVNPFLPTQAPNGPIDLAFGPEGDMFLLEYDAHALYQVQYTGTCKMNATSLHPPSSGRDGRAQPGQLSLIPYQGRIFLPTQGHGPAHYDGLGIKHLLEK
jgi:cytochrome c